MRGMWEVRGEVDGETGRRVDGAAPRLPVYPFTRQCDIASYTLTLVIIGQPLAIFSASSRLLALITV